MLEELQNGATIIAQAKFEDGNGVGYVVLARWRDGEFVSWVADARGYCHWGRYGREAFPAFVERCERYLDVTPLNASTNPR